MNFVTQPTKAGNKIENVRKKDCWNPRVREPSSNMVCFEMTTL